MLTPNDGVEGLYMRACAQGCWSQIWSVLTGCPCHLLSLTAVQAAGRASGGSAAGVQTVAIRQIRGSEGRNRDFDRNFNPLMSHSQERWMRVAEAQQRGVPLPLVQLIRVGELYFVRDGHHRISVARALRQEEIEADVVVWAVDEPLPWTQPAARQRQRIACGISRASQAGWGMRIGSFTRSFRHGWR